jgi:hypothetical protein
MQFTGRHCMEDDSTVTPHLVMSQWVIYDHPRDFPDKYMMRRWEIREPGVMQMTDDIALANTLEEIRLSVPPGLFCLERFKDDDPCIVEVWL